MNSNEKYVVGEGVGGVAGRSIRILRKSSIRQFLLEVMLDAVPGAVRLRVERFGRRGNEPFEPFEPFEFFQK